MKGELIIEVNGKKEVKKDLLLSRYGWILGTFFFGNRHYKTSSGAGTWDRDHIRDKRGSIGTGTTDPTRSDTSLGNQVASTTSVSTTKGSDYISWGFSITVSAAYDITEAGLESEFLEGDVYNGISYSDGYTWRYFIRDTFSARSLTSGDTISITFKLTF